LLGNLREYHRSDRLQVRNVRFGPR
jgi:hypothetical protein